MTKQHSFTRDELLACGQGELFGPGNAQLPAPNMLMLDRITHISEEGGSHGKGQLIAELDISPDLWFFDCHFPGDPVMPGCLGLDAMWQLVASTSAGSAIRAVAARWAAARSSSLARCCRPPRK